MTDNVTRALLPPNATEWEKHLAQVSTLFTNTPIPLRTLWHPDTCPVSLLPYLAWAFSVDQWDANWPEPQKRDAIKSAFYIHQHKGTVGAVRRAVQNFGGEIRIVEWWEDGAEPGTFRLEISLLDTGISESDLMLMMRQINQVKPLSRHLTDVKFSESVGAMVFMGAALVTGNTLTLEAGA
ncbi:phage tail protein I [Serratia marcescens]|uniref:phage tail protein I n=1 Tax=Serratia marcescens TaxID=615 RepID=UPI0024C4C6B4|nr:phage tail protein I [Serratia marcescens]MDK1707007.1 phage tail protein I [Serratia marcescens]